MSFLYLSEQEQKIIASEFNRIQDNCYLDHAGTTLYSEKQLDSVLDQFKKNIYSNPHASKASEDLIDQVRYRILKHFNADPSEFSVVFTSGSTGSLKLVADYFDFGKTGCFAYIQENHTSVLGMRNIVKTDYIYVLNKNQLLENLVSTKQISSNTNARNLLVFSAQCNFSGYKFPLELVNCIQKNGLQELGKPLRRKYENKSNIGKDWFICLDAASFAATNFLDLKRYKADFVCVSFYKLFGYPTGLGALIVSKRGEKVLRKNYFGGGTVKIAMSSVDFYEQRDTLHERFEDGTIDFLAIAALPFGFQTLERLVPSNHTFSIMERISRHVFGIAKYCYEKFLGLHYKNNANVIRIYSHTNFQSFESQGGIVTFNLLDETGNYIGFAEVACIADLYKISLRTGCFCNPGCCQVFLDLSDEDVKNHYKAGHVCGDYKDLVNGSPTGAIRLSFGYMTTTSDIDKFVNIINECYIKNSNAKLELLKSKAVAKEFYYISKQSNQNLKMAKLRQICIYPIKSCAAFKISTSWEITNKGLKYDRCWMIVNENGVAVTQKSNPALCLITPQIDDIRKVLTINYPGKKFIEISIDNWNSDTMTSSMCMSKVCGDSIEGLDCGDSVAKWLSICLSQDGLRLLYQATNLSRKTKIGSDKQMNLSNKAQYLLVNYASVQWLASKVKEWTNFADSDVTNVLDRFRGNFIIENLDPLEELKLDKIIIDKTTFLSEGLCTRCQMICIDQKTGMKTSEPLRTIAREMKGKIHFGVYLSLDIKSIGKNTISCNDIVMVKILDN